MMKPYDMKRVNRSKSKDGGLIEDRWGIMNSLARGDFSSLYSGISMPSEMSLPRERLRRDLARIAVRDWATVSAMPPRICNGVSL